jgi:hypothetical protein
VASAGASRLRALVCEVAIEILLAMLDMAHVMGSRVIAEGIATLDSIRYANSVDLMRVLTALAPLNWMPLGKRPGQVCYARSACSSQPRSSQGFSRLAVSEAKILRAIDIPMNAGFVKQPVLG